MKKALLIGLILCILAMAGIGAAFATGMNFTNVGALSMGTGEVPQINVADVGWNLHSGTFLPVVVWDVKVKFEQDVEIGSVVFVSLRDSGFNEIAYAAEVTTAKITAGTWGTFALWDTSDAKHGANLPGPDAVYFVKVTVAENGTYVTSP